MGGADSLASSAIGECAERRGTKSQGDVDTASLLGLSEPLGFIE